jgi:hypothetical protein
MTRARRRFGARKSSNRAMAAESIDEHAKWTRRVVGSLLVVRRVGGPIGWLLGAAGALLELVLLLQVYGFASLEPGAALPEGERLFPAGQVTDRGERFRIAELIREKLTLELVEELPYGIAVEVENEATTDDGRVEVQAVIWVDREGQKPIVIGARGERLKRIGRAARLELNHLFAKRYHLTLWVKVRENWADDARALRQLEVE